MIAFLSAIGSYLLRILRSLGDLHVDQIAALAILGALLSFVGWGTGCMDQDTAQPRTDTLYVDRPLAEADTSGAAKPETRILYRTRTDTVTKACTVPVGYEPHDYSLVTDTPLTFSGQSATVTRYDLGEQRYVQDVYTLPFDRHRIGVAGAAFLSPSVQSVSPALSYRRRWQVPGGVLAVGPDIGVTWSSQHGREPFATLTTSLRF